MITLLPTDLQISAEELALLCTVGQDYLDRAPDGRFRMLTIAFISRLKVRLIGLYVDAGASSVVYLLEHVSNEIEELCDTTNCDFSMMDWMVCSLSNLSHVNDGEDVSQLADALLGGDLGELLRFHAYEQVGHIVPDGALTSLHEAMMTDGYGVFVSAMEEEADQLSDRDAAPAA